MRILLAHAKGDAQLAAHIAEPLASAGYEVLHNRTEALAHLAEPVVSRQEVPR